MNAEEWRPVARNPNYEVSSLGRVRRLAAYKKTPAGFVRKLSLDCHGYLRVGLSLRSKIRFEPVHVLVCEAFHGPRPDGHVAAHRNGNRADARADNLRWATPQQNRADRIVHGTDPAGERNPSAKLTEVNVWAIRARHLLGETSASLGKCFGVSPDHINRIVSGSAWPTAKFDLRPLLNPEFVSFLERYV